MRACIPVIFLLFLSFAANARPALAVWTDLDESQIQGAIKYGERFKFYDNDRFLREWLVVLRRGADKVSVSTKFNMIALASRDAAKESRKLRPEEIKAILDEVDNKLGFTLILFGSTSEFARNFHAVLHYDDIYVQPVRKHNALATPYGWQPMAPPIMRAFCSYEFPFDKIDPNAEVSLIIISPLGGEAELFFDLSKMR
ncbi:MAG: hypothetical protein GY800_06815 [Planctomycetes bacterium]|nr:hypothetical protein [Planctomycetota bacterium]